jgi:hypothetical protein
LNLLQIRFGFIHAFFEIGISALLLVPKTFNCKICRVKFVAGFPKTRIALGTVNPIARSREVDCMRVFLCLGLSAVVTDVNPAPEAFAPCRLFAAEVTFYLFYCYPLFHGSLSKRPDQLIVKSSFFSFLGPTNSACHNPDTVEGKLPWESMYVHTAYR